MNAARMAVLSDEEKGLIKIEAVKPAENDRLQVLRIINTPVNIFAMSDRHANEF